MNAGLKTFLLSVVVFSISFFYFYNTSELLPIGAGPDYTAHNDAVDFIYQNSRLPILPDDEEALRYTVYGSTRALRPPLTYVVTAVLVRLLPESSKTNLRLAYRKGSVLLCALTITLVFYSLRMFFTSTGIGLTGALLLGLMPQFTFIASYNNDDSGAIFTVTLMLTVLLLVYQRGLNMLLAVLFGLSSGLLILSKPTAWLLFPTIVLFILLFVRFATPKLIAYSVVVLTTTIIAGGWWIVFNIHHYGANDPFARKIAIHHAEQRSRLKPNVAKSFNEKGVSYYDLFIGSHRNFWGATARSTIGKLDWLKLNMGAMQYTLYLAVFFVALAYYFLRVGGFMLSGLSKQGDVDSADRRQLVLEGLLFFAIVFQISMYVWRNMNTEIQLQGKYIIPVALAVLFLFFAATHRFGNWLTDTLNEKGIYSLSIVDINRAGLLLFSVSIILIHLQGLWAHVIPFYRPRVHDLSMSGFRPLNINNTDVTIIRDIDTIEVSEGSLRISMTGPDPQLVLDPKFCESIIGNVLLKAKFQSDGPGLLQIFVDQGRGFNEDDSYRAKYGNDGSEVLVAMGNEHCSRIRLDPGTQPGQVVIDNISVARVRIRPLN